MHRFMNKQCTENNEQILGTEQAEVAQQEETRTEY